MKRLKLKRRNENLAQLYCISCKWTNNKFLPMYQYKTKLVEDFLIMGAELVVVCCLSYGECPKCKGRLHPLLKEGKTDEHKRINDI